MPLLTDLISYWPLDEASGNALDVHGSNTLAETSGTIEAASFHGITARDFEAGDTEYFSIADNTDLSVGDIDFAFDGWFRAESFVNFPIVFGKYGTTTAVQEYALYYDTTANRLTWAVRNSSSGTGSVQWGSALSTGVDYYFYVAHDSVNNLLIISVNNGTPATAAHTTGVRDGTRPFEIGASSSQSLYWDGLIAQVGFWKRLLTTEERTTRYNGGNGIVYDDFANPPEIVTAPNVIGQAIEGYELQTTNGSWTHNPSSYSIKWYSDTASDFSDDPQEIGGETSRVITLTDLEGLYVRSSVVATNDPGSSDEEFSNIVGPVAAAPTTTSTNILTAPVESGEQMPGGVFKFDGNATNGAIFKSPSNAAIPDLGDRDFVITFQFSPAGAPVTQFLWNLYTDTNNQVYLQRYEGSCYFIWKTGGVERINLGLTQLGIGVLQSFVVWRSGDRFSMATIGGAGLTYSETSGTITAGDTFDSAIKQQSGARAYIGAQNDLVTAKLNGTIGMLAFGLVPEGSTLLGDYNFGSVIERTLLMYDQQRLISAVGFSSDEIVAYGNWTDSSGTPKETILGVAPVAGDRTVCPFTGNYLTLTWNGAGTQRAYPPYTPPGGTLRREKISPLPVNNSPQAIDTTDGLATVAIVKDPSNNPTFWLDFHGPSGAPNRWPVFLPAATFFIDSSESNAKGIQYYFTTTNVGDSHSGCALANTPNGLLYAPFWHSNAISNSPTSGDTAFAWEQYWLLTDHSLPQLIETNDTAEWGTAYGSATESYTAGTKTYQLFEPTSPDGRTVGQWRSSSSADGRTIVCSYDHATGETIRKQVLKGSAGTDVRAYPGPVIRMSDGRRLATGFMVQHGGTAVARLTHVGVIVPLHEDMDTPGAWYTFGGVPFDGSGSNPTLGAVNLNNGHTSLHMTTFNDSFYPSLPSGGTGMDHVQMDTPVHITGAWEGIAAIVRVSEENADNSRLMDNSSGVDYPPWDAFYIMRWTYEAGNNRFVFRDQFDITEIIETELPGLWPQDTDFNSANAQHPHVAQCGTNRMLYLVNDPEDVAIAADLSLWAPLDGFTTRGLVFHKLASSDPTQYVRLTDDIFAIETDNSEGYGMFPVPSESGLKVFHKITNGEWNGSLGHGGMVTRAVDLTAAIRAAVPSGQQLIGGQLVGFPIVGQQIVGNKLVY